MEEVMIKLSEIESAAKHIMESAEAQKQAMATDLREQIQAYDASADKETAAKIDAIKATLESQKEEKIGALQQQTSHFFESLDQYYREHHKRLVQEIYEKIIK